MEVTYLYLLHNFVFVYQTTLIDSITHVSDIRHVVGCSCNQKRLRISERISRCIRAAQTTRWRQRSSSSTAVQIERWTLTSCATCSTHCSAKWRLHSRQVYWRVSIAPAFYIFHLHIFIFCCHFQYFTRYIIVYSKTLLTLYSLKLFALRMCTVVSSWDAQLVKYYSTSRTLYWEFGKWLLDLLICWSFTAAAAMIEHPRATF